MAKLARDVMTTNPACCTPETPLDQVAKLMVQHDCGEIPVIDRAEHVVGVVTDRDIVCRLGLLRKRRAIPRAWSFAVPSGCRPPVHCRDRLTREFHCQ